MKKICADFQITTPMFLGGADNKEIAELRPASIKGALRFWFRAINYGKYQNYRKVKKSEDVLFGSTNSQSSFFLKLNSVDIKVETNKARIRELFNSLEIGYLGYGLFQKKQFYRPYLVPGQTFTVELILKPNSENKVEFENLVKTIKALGLFGGLGSRSRRGFGSITLDSIYIDDKKYWTAPNSREELEKFFKDFYLDLEPCGNTPEYTAFSSDTKTIILDEYADYKGALRNTGRAMMDFRRSHNKDANIIMDYLHGRSVDEHPDRVVFGLPHNYFIRGNGKVDINPIIGSEKTRRSSPLFIKIISIKENNDIKYIPVMTVFPSEFLPKGSKISLKGERRGRIKLDPKILDPKVSFDLINEFMDTFPNSLEVKLFD